MTPPPAAAAIDLTESGGPAFPPSLPEAFVVSFVIIGLNLKPLYGFR
jgi:hypothetical protein